MAEKKLGTKGFTLVELMITVSIIGILAAIAVPLFNNYVYRGKQVEAKSLLMTIKVEQELFFAENSCYTANLALLPQSVKLGEAGNVYTDAGVTVQVDNSPPCDATLDVGNDFQAQASGALVGASVDYWGISDDIPAPVHCDSRSGYTAEQTAACFGKLTSLLEY